MTEVVQDRRPLFGITRRVRIGHCVRTFLSPRSTQTVLPVANDARNEGIAPDEESN